MKVKALQIINDLRCPVPKAIVNRNFGVQVCFKTILLQELKSQSCWPVVKLFSVQVSPTEVESHT